MKNTPWPAQSPKGMRPELRKYTIAAAQTIRPGYLVALNGSNQVTRITGGADPTGILGVAQSTNESGSVVYETEALVCVADGQTMFGFRASTALVAGDVDTAYGIVEAADGEWQIDKTDTVNTRVMLHEVFVDRQIAMCTILEANRHIPV